MKSTAATSGMAPMVASSTNDGWAMPTDNGPAAVKNAATDTLTHRPGGRSRVRSQIAASAQPASQSVFQGHT
jgi:hypothetical protein